MCFLPLFVRLYLLLSPHLPPHVLPLAITPHFHNPLFLSSNVIGIFEFHMLSGFFPGTRFGAAPWEARCCFEQCRIRSRKGCLCGGSRWKGRAGTEGEKSSHTNRTNPCFSHEDSWITNTTNSEGFRAQGTSMPQQFKKKKKFRQKHHHSFLNIYLPFPSQQQMT